MKKSIHTILILSLIILVTACIRRPLLEINEHLFCDLELIADDGRNFIANTHRNEYIEGGGKASEKISRSGKRSILLNKSQAFGLKYNLKNTKPNDYYEVSVWRYGNTDAGFLVVSDEDSKFFYKAVNTTDSIEESGWNRLVLSFYVPPNINNNDIVIYVWNPAEEDVYFDDLSIVRRMHEKYPLYTGVSPFKLYVDTMQVIKLSDKRKEAFRKGILETEDDDWVDGILFADTTAHHVELRLKGDWLDHLLGMKWSYRFKLDKEQLWNGMRTLSVQNPLTRDFLNEWLLHQFCLAEDILAPRYGFIPLYFNDHSRGIYAWEEHFEKYLIESNNRREGPILKLNEDNFWKANLLTKRLKVPSLALPIIPSAQILPFKYKRTTKDSLLLKQFEIAQDLYYQYKYAIKPASEIFDVEKLAKYMAMLDLFSTYHGINWHNQRFYYNPVLSKLEPIIFDNFSEKGAVRYVDARIAGNTYLSLQEIKPSTIMLANVFRDEAFTTSYIKWLQLYTEPVFIQKMLDRFESDITRYDSLLSIEFPDYKFSTDYIFENAKLIREELPQFEKNLDQLHSSPQTELKPEPIAYTSSRYAELTEGFVTAYTEFKTDSGNVIMVENYHPEEIVLLGTSKKENRSRNLLYPETTVPAVSQSGPGTMTFISDNNARFLYFMFRDDLESFTVPIRPWRSPGKLTPLQGLLARNADNFRNYFVEEKKGLLLLREGVYTISEDVVIPHGYQVVFEEGTVLDLTRGAAFISYSSVDLRGSRDKAVIIKSSDGTANAFTVLQAPDRSFVEYAIFDRLNTIQKDGWNLTGAVTFYESDVEFQHTSFQNNQCEDGLNIIRSEFLLNECSFTNTFGDALDVDFGSGKILHSSFKFLNNDAIDVSGSDIVVDHCEVDNSNDKGISGGENSRMLITNTRVSGSVVGMASKDLSELTIQNCEINDCRYGLLAFRKKPEFGPAHIVAKNVSMTGIGETYLIEEGSSCRIDDKYIEPNHAAVAEIFY